MQYMLLLYVTERPAPGTPQGDAFYGAIRAFHRDCAERGVLVAAAPLADPPTARTVRSRSRRMLVTDGPFAETTEWLAGYFVVDCAGLEQALEIAARCPVASAGSVELRPVGLAS